MDTDHQPAQPRAGRTVLRPADLRALNEVRAWAQTDQAARGNRVIDSEWVQLHLARVHAKAEFLKLMNWRIAWGVEQSPRPRPTRPPTKVFGTEFATEAYRLLMEVLGTNGGAQGLSRRAAARADRADASVVTDPDVRRRHQRGAAGHHRRGGSRPAEN